MLLCKNGRKPSCAGKCEVGWHRKEKRTAGDRTSNLRWCGVCRYIATPHTLWDLRWSCCRFLDGFQARRSSCRRDRRRGFFGYPWLWKYLCLNSYYQASQCRLPFFCCSDCYCGRSDFLSRDAHMAGPMFLGRNCTPPGRLNSCASSSLQGGFCERYSRSLGTCLPFNKAASLTGNQEWSTGRASWSPIQEKASTLQLRW